LNNTKFKNIAVVGVGLIGGSISLALKRKNIADQIIGIDDKVILEKAKARGAIDVGYKRDQIGEAVAQADLIFICTPILTILQLLPRIAEYAPGGALISDVGSTKQKIVQTANTIMPKGKYFIGGHPMAGAESRGIESADSYLFENTIYVLTPVQPTPENIRREFGELLETIGAKVLLLTPTLHDEIAAAVSHLPQLAAVALMNLVGQHQSQSPHFLKMAAGGFRSMTRVASSSYRNWEDIINTNRDMIMTFIEKYIFELQHVKENLDQPILEKRFIKATVDRMSIPTDTRGFLKPLYDIGVVVEDKPGVLATIATTLADENINIKDVEVLKVREEEGGTMRFAFASEQDREKALQLLRTKGFECRKRD
jgi:prephenate dehydrogenase